MAAALVNDCWLQDARGRSSFSAIIDDLIASLDFVLW
jgi:hypothetical protein